MTDGDIKFRLTAPEKITTMIAAFGKDAIRAAEIALDKTAWDIRAEVRKQMPRVFDRPVKYTLNSLRVTKTHNHNMQASVWFKEPDRMEDHYLVPQVEGGVRKTKGFERALDNVKFVPGRGADLTPQGNLNPGQLQQIVSVLGKANKPGFQANITKKSAIRNKKERDYIELPRGSGKLPPGIYRRVVETGKAIDATTYRRMGLRGAKAYQIGRRIGKFATITKARGLSPILIRGKQRSPVRPRLPFYQIAKDVQRRSLLLHFNREFSKRMR